MKPMNILKQLHPSLNAYTLKFNANLLNEIIALYEKDVEPFMLSENNNKMLIGGQIVKKPVAPLNNHFLVSYGKYPLFWISANNIETHAIYQKFFNSLSINEDVKQLIDFDKNIIMYCGFLVIGNRAPVPNWHVDYEPNANAYTLITPLYSPASDHGDLLYKHYDGNVETYQYSLGEAVIFGDHFLHSTKPYAASNTLRVMLSLTFGTDKMLYWEALKKTIGSQSEYLMLPNQIWTKQ